MFFAPPKIECSSKFVLFLNLRCILTFDQPNVVCFKHHINLDQVWIVFEVSHDNHKCHSTVISRMLEHQHNTQLFFLFIGLEE